MTNLELASAILDRIEAAGGRELVVCGGSRNAPLVAAAAARTTLRSWNFFEERSAAFFALGRSRDTRRPVAVVTTSGTAAAELLPAAIEAFYSGVPLILVTADRPKRHRGTGAPQAIEQRALFGTYAPCADLSTGGADDFPPWHGDGPLHVNATFDEPLLDAPIPPPAEAKPFPTVPLPSWVEPPRAAGRVARFLTARANPLVIAGALDPEEAAAARDFILRLGAPLLAEPLSGLRDDPSLDHLALVAAERSLAELRPDGVLRLGGVPATRFWRDLDETLSLPVLSCSRLSFSGLPRAEHIQSDVAETLRAVETARKPFPELQKCDREIGEQIGRTLDAEPDSEPALFRTISHAVPAGSFVYLGNSLPIREWDLFATRRRHFVYGGNRGANGIDGQISTFLGMCGPDRENWCIAGDLTAMYDLAAPWVVRQIDPGCVLRIVVVNNGGGRIFARVPALRAVEAEQRERLFENPHAVDFEPWARMWELDSLRGVAALRQKIREPRVVIELRPDAAATVRCWDALDRLDR